MNWVIMQEQNSAIVTEVGVLWSDASHVLFNHINKAL